MTSYKKIIENIVESEVHNFVEKKNDDFCRTVDGSLKLSTEDKQLGFPSFEIQIEVGYHDYRIVGYVSEYGNVVICAISFERTYLEPDEEGFLTQKTRTERNFIHGKEIDSFEFNR